MAGSAGGGTYTFQPVEGWGKGPSGHEIGLASSVVTDSEDRVYLFNRAPEPAVLVFDREGTFLHSWGQEIFTSPHSIWIDGDDHLYLTDNGDHTVRKFTADGRLLQTWGTAGRPGSSGEPFNGPTWAMVGPSGALYVSDGYGQARVHKFAPSGELLLSWGEPGAGPGRFNLPHSVWVDREEQIYIVDRENHRIQIFDSDGNYQSEWTGFVRPQDIFIDADDTVYVAEARPAVSILTLAGELLARIGEPGSAPGQFQAYPHAVWVDSYGDLYVGEVPSHTHFQKFARV